MKQRRENRKLDGIVRSHLKSLYVPCMYPSSSINAKLQKERERKDGQKEVATVSIPYLQKPQAKKLQLIPQCQIRGLKPFFSG